MQTAIELANRSDCAHRHGAVVIKGGRVIGLGYNRYRNEPSDLWEDNTHISIHAEVDAISRCSKEKLRGAIVYVARKGKCTEHKLSRPCPACHKKLVEAGVKRIVYTD